MFYFAYAGHLIPPKRIEFGKIQKNPPGPGGGGTRISITGKTSEEKAVWQTLGEGNEDCVEWVVLCAALNLLDDEILKAAEKAGPPPSIPPQLVPGGGPSNSQPPPGRQGQGVPQRVPPHHQPSSQSLQSTGSGGRPHQLQQQQPHPNGVRGPPPGPSNGQQRAYTPNALPVQTSAPGQQPYHPRPQRAQSAGTSGGYQLSPQGHPIRGGSVPPPNNTSTAAQPIKRV